MELDCSIREAHALERQPAAPKQHAHTAHLFTADLGEATHSAHLYPGELGKLQQNSLTLQQRCQVLSSWLQRGCLNTAGSPRCC